MMHKDHPPRICQNPSHRCARKIQRCNGILQMCQPAMSANPENVAIHLGFCFVPAPPSGGNSSAGQAGMAHTLDVLPHYLSVGPKMAVREPGKVAGIVSYGGSLQRTDVRCRRYVWHRSCGLRAYASCRTHRIWLQHGLRPTKPRAGGRPGW